MKVNRSLMANVAVWFSGGYNLLLFAVDLWHREYAAAGAEAMLVALITAWLCFIPKVEAWIDARLAEATARNETAQVLHAEVQRMVQAGEVGFRVAATASARVN